MPNRIERLMSIGVLGREGNAFNPLTLFPLIWFDFSDITTLFQDAARSTPITTDGQIVQGVADKSGNGWHVEVGTATYKTNIQNGKSAVLYDGVTDYLRTATVTHGIGTNDFYFVAVDRPISISGVHTIWSNGSYNPAFYHKDPGIIIGYFEGYTNFIPGTSTATNHIVEIYRSLGTLHLLVDGVDMGTAPMGNIVNNFITLGWDNYASGDRYNGYQMEFLLFNTLPVEADRIALRTHLSSKWGF